MSQTVHPAQTRADTCWQTLLKAGAIILFVVVTYLPVLRAGFIWDDDDYVTSNRTLRDEDGLRQIWFKLGATYQYYPLVHTTFWIEYHLWKLNPLGYHVVNVLLHTLGAILLWRVLKRLQVSGAWLAVALFAIHPVQVESVAWVTERKNVLSGVFYFAAALLYLRFTERRDAGEPGRRLPGYWCALFLFVCALFSKTVTCSLPAALLLVRWWQKGRLLWRDVMPLLPFFVIGIVLSQVTAWMEKHVVGAHGTEWSFTFLERCLIAGRALWFYAGKLVWPTHLTFVYPRWGIDASVWWQWLFPAAAAGVVVTLWAARNRIGRGPLVAVLLFAGTLVPALGFVNVYPMRFSFVADHFQYLASVGLITLAAVGLNRFKVKVGFVLLPVLALLTWQQVHVYKDMETLWRDTLKKNPTCWLACNNLGLVSMAQGNLDEAEALYCRALAAKPNYAEAWNNLGQVLHAKGSPNDAINCYQRALEFKPDFAEALNNMGVSFSETRSYTNAAACFRTALQLSPQSPIIHHNLADALRELGQIEDAIRHDTLALDAQPSNPGFHNSLGVTLARKGDMAGAIREFQAAIQFKSDHAGAHLNLADVLLATGSRQSAITHYLTGLSTDSNNAAAQLKLGLALAAEGNTIEALDHLRQAVKQNANLIEALNGLAWLLATHPDAGVRSGAEAIACAEHAARLTNDKNPAILDTLAASYAEAGRFVDAVTTAQRAATLAASLGKQQLLQTIQTHLDAYQARKPWRE